MNRTKIVCALVCIGAITCCMGGNRSSKHIRRYTAETLIEVLPYVEQDPMVIGAAAVDKDTQYRFRQSMAALIKRQNMLEQVICKDKIRETDWFKQHGPQGRYETIQGALEDLEKNLHVSTQENVDFIEISMSCNDEIAALLIVKEIVQMFLDSQRLRKQMEIEERLNNLEKRRRQVYAEYDDVEKALDDVRTRTGFTDLEDHSYPHPVIVRLNRLQRERDNLVIEMKGIKAMQENVKESQDEKKSVELQLIVLQSKLVGLEKMLEKTIAKKRDFDRSRIEYKRRAAMKDERRRMHDEIMLLIEKLRIMRGDPRIHGLRFMRPATLRQEPEKSSGPDRK